MYKLIKKYPGCIYKLNTIFKLELGSIFSYEIDGNKYTTQIDNIDSFPYLFELI